MQPNDLNLPKDRITLNALLRSFYMFNPIIHETIEFHTNNIYNNIVFTEPDQDQWKVVDGVLRDVIREFILIGECFVYATLNEETMIFDELRIINPDYVIVKKSITDSICVYSIRPDENLRRAVMNDADVCLKIDSRVVNSVKSGQNIDVDSFYFSHLVRKFTPYEIRGTSYLMPSLDKLREGKVDEVKTTIMYPQEIMSGIQINIIGNFYDIMSRAIIDWIRLKILQPYCKLNNVQLSDNFIKFQLVKALSVFHSAVE